MIFRERATSKDDGLFKVLPLFLTSSSVYKKLKMKTENGIVIRLAPLEEKAWVLPMMFGQAALTAWMYYEKNYM